MTTDNLNTPHRSRVPLPIEFKKLGFQDQEAWTLVENEERSVDNNYVSNGAFGSVTYSPSNQLRSLPSSSKSCFLNFHFQ